MSGILELTSPSSPYNCPEPVRFPSVALVAQGWLFILQLFCGLCRCCRKDAILNVELVYLGVLVTQFIDSGIAPRITPHTAFRYRPLWERVDSVVDSVAL